MARRGSFDADDGAPRGVESDASDEDDRRHHTLTLAQGRALRRELSRHTLHALGGERVCEESSPETTLESTKAEALGRAFLASTGVVKDETATARRWKTSNANDGRWKGGRIGIRSTRRRVK
jgi:hypothetical protein